MPRFWTSHWQNRNWRANEEFELINHAAGNSFRKRGVSAGDVVYVVSLAEGQLLLGGRLTVARIVSRAEAVGILGTDILYTADEHVIGEPNGCSPLNLHRRLSPALARHLRFVSRASPEPAKLCFVSKTRLDNQTTRGVRELTPESAELLERIIEVTDRLPRTGELVTVTEDMLRGVQEPTDSDTFPLPDRLDTMAPLLEGTKYEITGHDYKRAQEARRRCIAHYGTECSICGFSFGQTYGQAAAGLIHVHHERPLSEIGEEFEVNPVEDLKPVCPNCHAVLHRRNPPYNIDDVRGFLRQPSGASVVQ